MENIELSKYNFEVSYFNYIILYNSVTNTYALFESDDYVKFKNNIKLYLSEEKDFEKIHSLWQGGFIVANQEEERLRIRDDFLKKAYNTSVYNLTIIPTNACNLACPYCFAVRSEESMSSQTVQKVVSYFEFLFEKEGHNLKHFNTKWFGGEPLLCPKQIEEISSQLIDMCYKADVEYHACIYTNLTLLNDDICKILKNGLVSTIYTTMDGVGINNDLRRPAKNGKQYFNTLIENIKKAKEFSNVKILVNIDKRNEEQIDGLIDYLANEHIVDGEKVEVGFNLINDNEYIYEKNILLQYDSEETDQMIDSFLKKMGIYSSVSLPSEALNCFAMARNSVVIDPNGMLKKCGLGKPYGSLYDDFHNVYEEMYFSQTYDPFKKKKCVECPVFPVCYGGCIHDGEICTIKHLLATRIRRYFDLEFDLQKGKGLL